MNSEQITNRVTFDINIPVTEYDLDILELYVSNKNQTGPNGDCTDFKLVDETKRQLVVNYEQHTAKNTVLEKKFFHFKQYFLRASELGYKKEQLKSNPNLLILTSIQDDKDNCKVELFAEYLLPDNPLESIEKSSFFTNTYYVTYKDCIDQELLHKRYLKKQDSLKNPIKYLTAFQTSSILIRNISRSTNVNQLMKTLTADITSRLGSKPNIFLDQFKNYLLCQFKSELDTSKFIDSIRPYLVQHKLTSEYCYNFELTNNDVSQSSKADCIDKPTQTELCDKKSTKPNSNVNNTVPSVLLNEHEAVYECFNDTLKGISIKDSPPKNSIQISNPVLRNSLVKCAKILHDFRRDLEKMLDKCKLSLRSDYSNFDIILKPSDFDSVISKSIVTNLIASYEQERLRFEIFYVNSIITDKKENLNLLLQSLKHKKELEKFKSQLNIYFNSIKCIHAQYNKQSGCFEIFGYAQAVQCFIDYLNILQAKQLQLIEDKKLEKQDINLSVSKDFRVEIFYKFDAYYFRDFQKRLAEFDAVATIVNRNLINIKCSNQQQDANMPTNLSWKSDARCSKDTVLEFIQIYLSQFDSAVVNLPFDRDSEEAFKFWYDKYSLDANWLSESQIKLFGVKRNIEDLQKKIEKFYKI